MIFGASDTFGFEVRVERTGRAGRARRILVSMLCAVGLSWPLVSAAQSRQAPQAEVPVYTNADLESEAAASSLRAIDWSKEPGVFEAELERRYGNPLFEPTRRQVDESEVLAARRRDAEQMWAALEQYIELANDKKRMARYAVASQMGDALLRLDETTWSALRAGGAAYELAASTQKIRLELLSGWQGLASVDPGVKALLDAEKRVPPVKTESPPVRFLALLQAQYPKDDGPIRRYEVGAALLSEEVETIEKVHSLLRGQLRESVRDQLASALKQIGRNSIEFEGKAEKVAAVAKLLGSTPAAFGVRVD